MYHVTPTDFEERTYLQQAQVPYLEVGFRKVDVSDTPWFEKLREHYEKYQNYFGPEVRDAHLLNTDPQKQPSLVYFDSHMNTYLHNTLQPIHEEWCGKKLIPTSCYGMRKYLSGSYLYNHVDRTETHVISSTLCIHNDLDERWPLYIEKRPREYGYEVDINPGEMVLYESATLKHGRPYDLKGRFYISQFIHYKLA